MMNRILVTVCGFLLVSAFGLVAEEKKDRERNVEIKIGVPPVELRPLHRIRLAAGGAPAKQSEDESQEDALDENATTEDKIAAFLKKREADARKPRSEQMLRRIEELEEIVGITEKQKKDLRIASKGAVEKSLDPWRKQMDEYVRQYLQRAPQNVDMVLASIGNVNFGQSPEQQAAAQSIWQATIEKVLDAKQMETYRKAADARRAFLYRAVSDVLIADLDRNLRLTAKQRVSLRKMLVPIVEENLSYLDRWSNDGNLPVYQLPTLLGGVDSEVLEKVLSEQQIEGWTTRYANFKGMWDAIQRQKENQQELEDDEQPEAEGVDE